MKKLTSTQMIEVERYDPITGSWFLVQNGECEYYDEAVGWVEKLIDEAQENDEMNYPIKYCIVTTETEVFVPVPKLSEHEIRDAIDKVMAHCDVLEATDYHPITLRSILEVVGYKEKEQQDRIIEWCAARGFDYCIDPLIATKSYPDFVLEHPSMSACYWGPDQLTSRLNCVI